jgi:hypothetical protein
VNAENAELVVPRPFSIRQGRLIPLSPVQRPGLDEVALGGKFPVLYTEALLPLRKPSGEEPICGGMRQWSALLARS